MRYSVMQKVGVASPSPMKGEKKEDDKEDNSPEYRQNAADLQQFCKNRDGAAGDHMGPVRLTDKYDPWFYLLECYKFSNL